MVDAGNPWSDQREMYNLLCPVCGFSYTSFEVPDFTNAKQYWDGQGVSIAIPMACENNHHWKVVLGFHKGMSYIGVIDIDEAPDQPPAE